jgi:RNA polymerase sigma factor (sigma-70 family)
MARFATTRWTMVRTAVDPSDPDAVVALEDLCRIYWPAVFAYVRSKGHSTSDASDLTQEFFLRVLEKGYFEQARRERGTFRTFLLTCVQHFLANEWDRTQANKRGGGQLPLSLDQIGAESRYLLEPRDDLTPEAVFEQQWACSVVQQALERLEQDVRAAGREEMYAGCRELLLGGTADATYAQIAAGLDLTEGTLKVQVHRLRRRLRELVLDEIEQTGATGDDAEAELQHLLRILRSPTCNVDS